MDRDTWRAAVHGVTKSQTRLSNWTELKWTEWVYSKRPWCWERLKAEEKGTTEEMVGWHHWHNGHEFEQALGVGDGQGGLACCSPWGHEESDTTERLNWTELNECLWMEWVIGWIYLEWPLAGARGALGWRCWWDLGFLKDLKYLVWWRHFLFFKSFLNLL